VFSSRPGAPFKLWLDFVGSVVTESGEPSYLHLQV
jgi:hypothetical protein